MLKKRERERERERETIIHGRLMMYRPPFLFPKKPSQDPPSLPPAPAAAFYCFSAHKKNLKSPFAGLLLFLSPVSYWMGREEEEVEEKKSNLYAIHLQFQLFFVLWYAKMVIFTLYFLKKIFRPYLNVQRFSQFLRKVFLSSKSFFFTFMRFQFQLAKFGVKKEERERERILR